MKYLHSSALLLLLSLVFISCEKNLTDLQPIDQIPAEKAITNMNDLGTAVNGVYGTWSARRSVYISAFISDEIKIGSGTEYRNVGNALFNWQFVSDSQDWRDEETGGVWRNLYQVIDRANRVLEFMDPVPTNTPAEASLKTQYRGEMLALRAMAHLELLRNFAATPEYTPTALGVVLQTAFVKAPGSYRPSRNTQQEVISSIYADLSNARQLIPTSFTDIGRITRNAVIASQVRSYVHTKSWQQAADSANIVITAQPITGIANYPALWTTRTLAANQSTEVIWKLNVTASNTGSAIGTLFQDANGAQQAAPANKLLNSYVATDVRFTTFFRTSPRPLIAKYGVVIPPATDNFIYDIKMIRTSEILLARAEARAELNMITESNADLALLRTNRIPGYVHIAIATKAALIDAIYLERYKELCYEGQRYYDLKRRSIPITRDVSDIGGVPTSQMLPVSDLHYLLPIPNAEILANNNIKQNAGF